MLSGAAMTLPGKPNSKRSKSWFVYILRCSNGSLYTGITTDVQKRLGEHNDGRGSAYVRAHRPAKLVAFTPANNRSDASILECFVKSLRRTEKLALAKKWQTDLRKLKQARRPAKPRRTRSDRGNHLHVEHRPGRNLSPSNKRPYGPEAVEVVPSLSSPQAES